MTVRVRFAPSPTGHLHVGGARTALFNYLFAKKEKGTLVLRIEDTDQERSKKEYEEEQKKDLQWLGIEFDEGPDTPGNFGPYRQSERLDLYKEHAEKLIAENKAYYCFCSEEELMRKKEVAQKEGRPPHYDGTCRHLSYEEATGRLSSGEKAVIRFHVPEKSYVFHDHVRGRVVFPKSMVGDFVILRSNGLPVYNFCCVVDDYLMKISHVIRAEDHLSNTCRQLMIYEALGAESPQFIHVSLLIGKDRQKLSKRHGATSVTNYKNDSYLSSAMVNYLSLLGWSHPEEKDVFDLSEAINHFTLDRFNKAPAIFDFEKFKWVNGQHIKKLPTEQILEEITPLISADHLFHQQDNSWKTKCVDLYKDQVLFYKDFIPLIDKVFQEDVSRTEDLEEILSWETTPQIKNFINDKINELIKSNTTFITEEIFSEWQKSLKKDLKIKGKPLFMGMRGVLTGEGHGPELKFLIPLTPLPVIKKRMEQMSAW